MATKYMKYEYMVYELTEPPAIKSHRQYARREAIACGLMPTLDDAMNAADVWFSKNPNRLEVEVIAGALLNIKTPASGGWITKRAFLPKAR